MKKKLFIGLSILGVAAIANFATNNTTTAVLQSEKAANNVFTVGGVEIEQTEWQRVVDNNGNWVSTQVTDRYGFVPDKLEEFDQDKLMVPLVNEFAWDDRKTNNGQAHQQSWGQVKDDEGNAAPGSNQLGDQKDAIDKFVFVQNTGEIDAYFRTIIAVEAPEASMVTHSSLNEKVDAIWLNINSNSRYKTSDELYTEIGGVRYYILTMTHTEALKPGEFARPSLLQAYLRKESTMETIQHFGDEIEIKVVSQAVQVSDAWEATAEKTAAEVALDTTFGEISKTNHPWK